MPRRHGRDALGLSIIFGDAQASVGDGLVVFRRAEIMSSHSPNMHFTRYVVAVREPFIRLDHQVWSCMLSQKYRARPFNLHCVRGRYSKDISPGEDTEVWPRQRCRPGSARSQVERGVPAKISAVPNLTPAARCDSERHLLWRHWCGVQRSV